MSMTQESSPAPRTLPHLCLHPEVESSTHSLRFSPLFIVQPRSRMMDDVTSPLKSALSTERLLDRAAELRAMALIVTTRQADVLNRRADRLVRLAAERQADAAPTIQTANSWFQHYRRTGDQRALRCAIACRDMAVERKRAATGLARAVTMAVESHGATTAVPTVQSRPSGTPITQKVSHSGQYVLSGLASIGVLILLFVSPFSDSGIIMREMPSVSAVAQTPMTQADAAEARPAQDEADQIASIRSQTGDVGQSAEEDASRPTAAVDPRMPGTKRGSGHRRAREPLVRPYAASHGTWLWSATANAGGNS
jgi:hypothetical protein